MIGNNLSFLSLSLFKDSSFLLKINKRRVWYILSQILLCLGLRTSGSLEAKFVS